MIMARLVSIEMWRVSSIIGLPPGGEVKDVGAVGDIKFARPPPPMDEPLIQDNGCASVDAIGGAGALALHLPPLVGCQVQLPYLQSEQHVTKYHSWHWRL